MARNVTIGKLIHYTIFPALSCYEKISGNVQIIVSRVIGIEELISGMHKGTYSSEELSFIMLSI